MSDTASSSRPTQHPSPDLGDANTLRAGGAQGAGGKPIPLHDDQLTIISSQPPIPAPAVSDSTHRILHGKLMPGDRLGHFELVRYVGGGGMGRVFCAVDTRLGRTVALKLLPPEQAHSEETRLRFQNEAQSAARLDHENIARVYHVGEDRGLHYIVFEFVEGVNIRTLVEQTGPLPLAETVSYSLQIVEALAHAADREVVHRDIKPSNILITPEGRVKLIDMGLARLRRANATDNDLTASGVTLGTFDYISPEQARDPRTADVRSDIYSLGCTFFYMLAGRPPFPEGTVLQKLLQHQADQPPDIRQFRPELPDEAARVLRKMLAKDPRHRYRFPVELVEDLTMLAQQIGLHPIGSGSRVLVIPREPKVSFLYRHLPWTAPVAALICIVFLLDFFLGAADQVLPPQPTAPLAKTGNSDAPVNDVGGTPEKTQPQVEPGQPNGSKSEDPRRPADPSDAGNIGDPPVKPVGPPAEKSGTPLNFNPAARFVSTRREGYALEFLPMGSGLSVLEGTSRALSVVPENEAFSGRLTGATGMATEPAVGLPSDPGTKRTGLLVVNGSVEGENEFPSLSAACRAAVNGDVIELRYDGRREERPISLANVKVKIRAGENYRPVIVFQPGEGDLDPMKYPRSMFTLNSGELELTDVAVELHVPRTVPAESWSLVEARGSQTVRLEDCWLSIYNASDQRTAYHEDVAFIRVKSAPDADAPPPDDGSANVAEATISLVDCVARGEAVFLSAADAQPLHLGWENGLLVTTERLLTVHGSQKKPPPGAAVRIDLQHLTARTQSGFCGMFDSTLVPHRPDAQIQCANSILMAGPRVSLIEQRGIDDLVNYYLNVEWIGDRNFYEGFDAFWKVCDLDEVPLDVPMDFAAWNSHWGGEDENLPHADQVIWAQLPEPDHPLHAHTPADYALSESTETSPNPAVGAAGGGRDAGFRADRLPPLPAEPAAEEPELAETSS
ncbi:MAG TPA: serine/threonine-protein kinase [Thermoguttaceae bacterium]|nr:serine/threonine-protein kinase [Thermoguttaceae bacterium]